jgi:hypothetical protein
MSAPKEDYHSFFLVISAQSVCFRCDKPSPIVHVRRPKLLKGGQRPARSNKLRAMFAQALDDEGWEIDLKHDKAFCPSCRRLGK